MNLNQNLETEEIENLKTRLTINFTFSYFTLITFFIAILILSIYSKFLFIQKYYFLFLSGLLITIWLNIL